MVEEVAQGAAKKEKCRLAVGWRSLVFLSLSLIFMNLCPLSLVTLQVKERQTHSTWGVAWRTGGVEDGEGGSMSLRLKNI